MRDRGFELRTVDAQERNVRVLSASRLFFGPDDADDAVAVFAFDPAIPAVEVAIDVAEGSHLFGHYFGPGSAQTLHGHFVGDDVIRSGVPVCM